MKKELIVKRNFIWNTIGSTINAFTSLIFLILVTRINDINEAGIFTFGFSLATLLSYVGLYYGRVYQVSNSLNYKDNDYTYVRYITCFIMIILGLSYILLRNYTFYKKLIVILLCFYKVIEVFFDNYYAIFQKNDVLYKVGISQTAKGILGIIVFFAVDLFTKSLIISIMSLIIINLFVFFIYDIPNINKYKDTSKTNKEHVLMLLKSGIYTFLISFFTMYLSNTAKYIIDFTLLDKFQTIFGIIIMPATIVILFVQYMIQPFVLTLKNAYIKKEFQVLKKILHKLSIITLLFGILIIIGGYFCGIPILSFVYGINLTKYKTAFLIILIGAILYGLSTIYSNVLIVFNKNRIQSIILFIISILSTIITYFLIINFDLLGAAYAYLFTMLLVTIMLSCVLIFCFKEGNKQ
jgi:O-antigen/teichoic acid export membrane protein